MPSRVLARDPPRPAHSPCATSAAAGGGRLRTQLRTNTIQYNNNNNCQVDECRCPTRCSSIMSDVAPAAVVLDLDLFSTIELPPKESDLVAADHDGGLVVFVDRSRTVLLVAQVREKTTQVHNFPRHFRCRAHLRVHRRVEHRHTRRDRVRLGGDKPKRRRAPRKVVGIPCLLFCIAHLATKWRCWLYYPM